MVLNLENYKSLGKTDPKAQHIYYEERIRNLKKFWVCTCGKRLSTVGFVWKRRFESFFDSNFFKKTEISCGYHCDNCADKREIGIDI